MKMRFSLQAIFKYHTKAFPMQVGLVVYQDTDGQVTGTMVLRGILNKHVPRNFLRIRGAR
jgi:hypothetical protein